jgi:hypothetical protein
MFADAERQIALKNLDSNLIQNCRKISCSSHRLRKRQTTHESRQKVESDDECKLQIGKAQIIHQLLAQLYYKINPLKDMRTFYPTYLSYLHEKPHNHRMNFAHTCQKHKMMTATMTVTATVTATVTVTWIAPVLLTNDVPRR